MKAKDWEGEKKRRVELGDEDDAEWERWRYGVSVNTRVTKGKQEQLSFNNFCLSSLTFAYL